MNIEKLKEAVEKAKVQHEELMNEILDNPDISDKIKNDMIKLREKFEKDAEESKKRREENKHRKIIGYDPENFEPIYE